MNIGNLTPLEVRDLITTYHSELRKLQFQINKVQEIIAELQEYEYSNAEEYKLEPAILRGLPEASQTSDDDDSSRGRKTRRGRPVGRKAIDRKTGPGRTRQEKTADKKTLHKGKGYRLSEWDLFVVNHLQDAGHALISSDLLQYAMDDENIKADEEEIKIKLNRSLHKLANRKGVLVKVEHSGRGFAYALSSWLNNRGELPKQFAR
jgi:hypothetical protein